MLIEKKLIKTLKTGREVYTFLIRCDCCKKERWLLGNRCKFGACRFCSRKCIRIGSKHSNEWKKNMSDFNSGEGNPFYGKSHKLETINQILETKRKNNTINSWRLRKEKLSPEEYQKWYNDYCSSVSGVNNAFYGKNHTIETKKHLSEVKAKLIADGTINIKPSHYGLKGFYYSSKMNEMFRYDSLIELLRMKMLDFDTDVITWTKRHGIRIPYVLDGQNKLYIPDFLIKKNNGNQILEELKGYEEETKKQAKFEALKNYCNSYGIIDKILSYNDMSELCQNYFGKSIYTLRKKYHEGKLFSE